MHPERPRAAKALRCRQRLVMTGTPVENDLGDLWSLFDFTSPGLLGDAAAFKRFARGLSDDPRGFSPLRRLVRPYILRRLKTDRRVIDDLPDKTELDVHCGLTRPQAALYSAAVEDLGRQMRDATGIQRRPHPRVPRAVQADPTAGGTLPSRTRRPTAPSASVSTATSWSINSSVAARSRSASTR